MPLWSSKQAGPPPLQLPSSNHALIFQGILWTSLFVLLGKAVSAAKEVAVAWQYGVSEQIDAYLFVFNLICWPVSIWFAALPPVLVPLVLYIQSHNHEDLKQFRAELFGLTCILSGLLFIATWFVFKVVLGSTWSGLPAALTATAADMLKVLIFLGPIGLLISLFSSWILAGGGRANTLLESLPALTILGAIIFFVIDGPAPLLWGTLLGFTAHLMCVATVLRANSQIERPRFCMRSPHWKVFWQSFGVMVAGQTLMSSAVLVDQLSAAQLPTGTVSILSYANRVLALVTGLGVTAVQRGTLPIFSKAQMHELQRLASPWVRGLFFIGLVSIGIGWWLGPFGVKLLFERGAFSSTDTEAVTHALRHGLFQLPFYFSGIVLAALLSARGRYTGIALASAGCLLVKIIGNAILVPIFGLAGLQWSTGLMYAFLFFMLWILAKKSAPAAIPEPIQPPQSV